MVSTTQHCLATIKTITTKVMEQRPGGIMYDRHGL
jgi:hypothetical protein